MYEAVGISKEDLYYGLRKMGKDLLKKKDKERWTPERPTTGYCYVVCQVIYHCLKPNDCEVFCKKMEDGGNHYFIKLKSSGMIIDLTADQFDYELDYSKNCSKPRRWLKEITKRGKVLACCLGLEPKT